MTPAIKTIPVSAYPPEAWQLVLGVDSSGEKLSPHAAYARVPIIYRCVRLRAKAARRIPLAVMKGKRDVSDTPDGAAVLAKMGTLMYQFEASQCVYAAAYALKQTGRLTGTPSLRWVTSAAITPKYDEQQGIESFKRRLKGTTQTLQPDELVYAWLPPLDRDIGPGVAPVAVALRAAGVLDNLDIFLDGFFDRGALRVTLLTVEGNPHEREIQKLEAWWKRVARGVKNAWNSIGVRANVKPVTIGDSLTDTIDVSLIDSKTMQALEAMEVPASIALPGAANYATARQDWLNLYEATIIPDAESIVTAITDQWLYPTTGMTLKLCPERLEVFQAAELDKAAALASLVGPVLTQNEARGKLELEPLATDIQDDVITSLRAKIELLKLAKEAGLDVYQIAPMVGLAVEKPEPVVPPQLPPPAPADVIDQEPPPDQERERMRSIDLYRWECKAIKRGKPCVFDSIWIAPDDRELIAERMQHMPIAQAFKIAPPGEGLDEREQRLYDGLNKLFSGYERSTLAAITAGGRVDLSGLAPDLRAALLADLTRIALDVAVETAEGIGPDLDPAAAATAASDWARAHAGELVKGVTDTTERIIQQAVAAYVETPGMSRAQLSAMLQGAFGARRSEVIAITEATRAAAQGARMTQEHLASFGLHFARVWRTVRQDTCPLCEPLDGAVEGDGWEGEGPPIHPRCRCAISLKEVKE